ncbi:hypothetical protein DH2020_002874 [Rehmannia glutinosa]|uniref:Annexin n=1 Tax=Rehmannia glutinosa TaxID=99300 RepID=A0ABR0XVE5_REHGL
MAASDELGSLTRAFSGLGVDENALITILGKWHPEQRQSFRKGSRDFFVEDERQFERWDDRHILQLRHEFLRPRKSCWVQKEHITPSFDHSIEEDVAFHVHGPERKLLVGLLSSYRYEGPKVNAEVAKFEAKALSESASKKSLIEDEELVRILSTRSKLHLKAIYKHYKEISGNYLDEVLDTSLRYDVDEITKEAVTRVIVTRADADMKQIKEEYHNKYGVNLSKRIEDVANGNYRDFLLTLIARGD